MAGDPGQHWIGWQYFRYTPLLQWPIGANPDLGLEISSSVVFTDSIPLMAFLFKPLNALLPDTFQYTGLWILICFSLQSFFAWKLLSLFTKDKLLPLIGSVFFIIAPIGLWRLGGHYSLFAQWTLLAGLYLYFTKKFSIFYWIGLLAATALIHAYLLAMVLAIWSADLIQRFWLKQTGILKSLGYFFAGIITTVIVMWAAGYFMVGKGVELKDVFGFSCLRMNLLAIIDPKDIYSTLLPVLKTASPLDDSDGFNFLGLGMLGLGLIASYILLRNIKIIPNTIPKAKLIPILIISLGLFLYAISNRIVIGPYELLSYPLPPITAPLTSTFRCSGRFFWPVYYAIYLAIFYLLFTRLKRSIAITLCVMMLFVQLIDSKDAWCTFRYQFAHSSAGELPMRSPAWNDIARQYIKIIVILPQNGDENWISSFTTHQYRGTVVTLPQNGPTTWITLFAATHRMAINIGLFARTNPEKEQEAKEHIITAISKNKLNSNSLYVFEDDPLWELASSRIGPSDVAGVLDGYRIIAPNLKECKTCNTRAIASITLRGRHTLE